MNTSINEKHRTNYGFLKTKGQHISKSNQKEKMINKRLKKVIVKPILKKEEI